MLLDIILGGECLKIDIDGEFKKEIRKIYNFYEINSLDSDVVSSHWQEYGNKTLISFNDDFSVAHVQAEGFDDFQKKGVLSSLKNIPIDFYINRKLYPLLPIRLIDAIENVVGLQKRVLSFNSVKQALCLNAIEKYGLDLDGKKIAIIGDGNGFMGMLLKNLYPNTKVIQINLAKVLMFDLIFTSLMPNPNELNVVLDNKDYLKSADFNFVPAEAIFTIDLNDVDFFINIASMQEMDPHVIKSYFRLIRSQNLKKSYFYCCNRVSKKLPDGTIVDFNNYPWLESDKVLFDEVCDWYSEFPMSRPPFVKTFDGMHKHRLIEV